MIQIDELGLDAQTEWLALLERCGGNALHLPATHLASVEREQLRLLRIRDGETAIACALAVVSVTRGLRRVLGGGSRTLTLPTGPAAVPGCPQDALRDALFCYARELRCDRVVVQAPYGGDFAGDPSLSRFQTGSVCEFILSIGGEEEAMLAGYHKTHRKNVRRAIRQGLEIREDGSLDGLLALRAMQLSSAQRASEKAEGFGVPDENYFVRLHEHLYRPGHGRLIFADLDGEAVAALAWITAANRAQTVRSGSSAKGYETRAMYLLYDELIRRCVREGVVELNCGGVPVEAQEKGHAQRGLYEFKEGFGGARVIRYALDIPLKEMDS